MRAPDRDRPADRIDALDVSLFEAIPSQTTENDRRSLLALYAAARRAYGDFAYLEIGSHLGGSLQVLVAEPACTSIVSIDARPPSQPDERGREYPYPDNSTEAMVAALGRIPAADLAKLETLDTDAAQVPVGGLSARPRLCFVDGEHTDSAVQRDAEFCRRALDPRGGVIVFHDVGIVYHGLARWIYDQLRAAEQWLTPFALPDSLLAVEVGSPTISQDPRLREHAMREWEGVLWLLESNRAYREFFRSRRVRLMRRLGLAPRVDLG